MVERLFLDRVDAESCAATEGGQHHLAVQILPHKTEPAITFLHLARAGAKIANDTITILVPPSAGLEKAFLIRCRPIRGRQYVQLLGHSRLTLWRKCAGKLLGGSARIVCRSAIGPQDRSC